MMRRYLDRMMRRGEPASPFDEVAKLDLRPGDMVVARLNKPITFEAVERMREEWAKRFPDNKIVIFEGCSEVSVLSDRAK